MKRNANPTSSSLILGIISNVFNLIMTCVMFSTGYFIAGWISVVFPIYGLINSFKALKLNGMSGMLIASFILNAIGLLGGIVFLILWIVVSVMS